MRAGKKGVSRQTLSPAGRDRKHFFGVHLGKYETLRIENEITAMIFTIVTPDGSQNRSGIVIKGDKDRLVV